MGPCHELQRFCAGAPRTDIHAGMFDARQVPSENSALRPNFEGGTLVSVLESARDWHVRMTLRVWVAATQKQTPRTGSHRLAGPMAAEGRTGRSQTSHARFETDSVHPPPTPKARRPRFRPRRILSSNRFVGPCTRPILGAIGGHEAHAVDQHVIHLPAAVVEVHPVVDPDLAPPLRDDFRPHRRVGAVDDLARVGDPLTGVGLDAVEVRTLEEIGKEPNELGPLLMGAARPMAGERPACELVEVEQPPSDPPDLGPPGGLSETVGVGCWRTPTRLTTALSTVLRGPVAGAAIARGHHQPRRECPRHDTCPD